ncbi:DUF169 domain-containing protein [Ottowia sp. VDI28]|uniref:DUF169 domain-containing protein n=1 Tax=Ottowia sp. VDI28 TaxID=3133968 RepID=UPI003C308382
MPETTTTIPAIDGSTLTNQLFQLLRLKTTPVGIQMFERVEDMEAVPKIRRPNGAIYTTDQIIGQAARLGFTVGITAADLVGPQCAAVIGLAPQNEEWQAGKPFAGVWFATEEDAAAHQRAMHCVPYGRYQAMAVSPLSSGRLTPDICLVYANPAQMILLINGLQWTGYRKLEWGAVGESACSDSWGRALATGEPSLSLPCFPERRYGGVPDDEMLMALKPEHLAKALQGLAALARNGLRYPIPPYEVQSDVRAGMSVSYGKK